MSPYFGNAGETKDHTEPGTILKLKKSLSRGNIELDVIVPHDVYIWILRKGILKKGRLAKDRKYQIVVVWIPKVNATKKSITIQNKSIQHDSLQTFMRKRGGYDVFRENVKFDYKDSSIAKFYREIGIL